MTPPLLSADNWFAAWPTPQSPQLYAYQRCLDKFKHRHRWIVFIDIDEYVVLHNPRYKQLPDLLRNYEQYGGEPACSPQLVWWAHG